MAARNGASSVRYSYITSLFQPRQHLLCEGTRVREGRGLRVSQELTECDSTWTAVLVDGAWRLIDVYWATCHRVHTGDNSWELIDDGSDISSLASTPRGRQSVSKTEYAYNDYYFLTGLAVWLMIDRLQSEEEMVLKLWSISFYLWWRV